MISCWFHQISSEKNPPKTNARIMMVGNGWKWLEMVGNGWKRLEMVGMFRFFWSTVDSLARSPTFRGRNVSHLLGMSGCFQAS